MKRQFTVKRVKKLVKGLGKVLGRSRLAKASVAPIRLKKGVW